MMRRTGAGGLGISKWRKNLVRLENKKFEVTVSGEFYDEVNSVRNQESIFSDNCQLIRSLLREYVDKKKSVLL